MQERSKAAVVYCDTYDEETVYLKIKKGLDLLGGIGHFISKDEKVLLKLNLVRNATPESAITTHPSIVKAISRILYEEGCRKIKAGDSSGFGSPTAAMTKLGLDETFEKYGIQATAFKDSEKVDNTVVYDNTANHAKQFVMAKDVLEADALISLPKMKTHALEYITGAVKNQYGCISGANKAMGHAHYPNQDSFAKMLVELNSFVSPRLYILDGIVAMEGNGPASGDPISMNVIIISDDPIAVDTIFSRLIYLDPLTVPTISYGIMYGQGNADPEKIEILTEDGPVSMDELVEKYGNPDFNVERQKHKASGIMNAVTGLNIFKRRPQVIADKCIKCGICNQVCPAEPKAITFADGKEKPPIINRKSCIKCFCCQEMCPQGAITVKGKLS